MIKIYTDGAVNPHSKNTAIGILIVRNGQQFQYKYSIKQTNNHEAEFQAAIKGFEKLQELHPKPDEIVFFYSDSKIVIESLEKGYAKHFQADVDLILKQQSYYQNVVNNWIADSDNKGAHNLALQALHQD